MMYNDGEQGNHLGDISGVFEDTSDLWSGGIWQACVIHIKG